MSNQTFQRELYSKLYNIQRLYGVRAEYVFVERDGPNLDTGDDGSVLSSIVIPRLIASEEDITEEFGFKSLFSGFAIGDRVFIIVGYDLPRGYKEGSRDYILYEEEVYRFEKSVQLPFKAGYIFHGRTKK